MDSPTSWLRVRDGPLRVDRAISGATSRLAFADPAGAIVEDDVVNLAAVLTPAPHAAPAVNREPLRLSAFRPMMVSPALPCW